MVEILTNDGFPAPIIVFVNQKKMADTVCRDVQRAGVSDFLCLFTRAPKLTYTFSVPRHDPALRQEPRAA